MTLTNIHQFKRGSYVDRKVEKTSNDYRKNDYIESLWTNLNVMTREHFYHVGGSEDNRNPMLEALISNFDASITPTKKPVEQTTLF